MLQRHQTEAPKSGAKAYASLNQGLHQGRVELMRPALAAGVPWPGRDHPIYFVSDGGRLRQALTAHARALAYFFTAAGARPHESQGDEVRRRAAVCRLLIEVKAPCFSAAPGTGYEDDHTFVAESFVRWKCHDAMSHERLALLSEYHAAGLLELDAPMDPTESWTGGKRPLEAAIRLGNPLVAGHLIKLGASCDNFDHGGPISVIDFARQVAGGDRNHMELALTEALMARACGIPHPGVAPARRIARL